MIECNKYLRKKKKISKECPKAFAAKLHEAKFPELNLNAFLYEHLQGYFTDKKSELLKVGDTMEDLILITTGAMVAFFKDRDHLVVPALFKAGEFVVMPRLFNSGKQSIHTLETSREAEFVVLPKSAYHTLDALNTGKKRLIDIVSEDYWAQHHNREILRNYHSTEKLTVFYRRYPDFKGDQPKVKIEKKMLATYLSMDQSSFSRALASLKKDKEQEGEDKICPVIQFEK